MDIEILSGNQTTQLGSFVDSLLHSLSIFNQWIPFAVVVCGPIYKKNLHHPGIHYVFPPRKWTLLFQFRVFDVIALSFV